MASSRRLNSEAIREEIQRFESVHPCIYAIYDLIELMQETHLAQKIRDQVVCIEGKFCDGINFCHP
jgi:Arf-GAP with GTPase, ANK repeat and PH domain-containing protein 1/3/4/5/6/9/11